VIRSNFNTHIASIAERHIAPPKTSHEMAETHGMFDTPAGPPDKGLYSMLVNKDGSFDIDPDHPEVPSRTPRRCSICRTFPTRSRRRGVSKPARMVRQQRLEAAVHRNVARHEALPPGRR